MEQPAVANHKTVEQPAAAQHNTVGQPAVAHHNTVGQPAADHHNTAYTSAYEYRAIAATSNIYDNLEALRERIPLLLNTGPLVLPEIFMVNKRHSESANLCF